MKLLFLHLHVGPVLNDRDDGGIGAGTTDTVAFQFLHQRGFSKAVWRCCKVLFFLQFVQFGGFAGVYLWKELVLGDSRIVHAGETRFDDNRSCRGEIMSLCADRHRGFFHDGGNHLGGDKPVPDQSVQVELIPGQVLFDCVRCQLNIGGPDRFMGILRRVTLAIKIGFGRQQFRPQ